MLCLQSDEREIEVEIGIERWRERGVKKYTCREEDRDINRDGDGDEMEMKIENRRERWRKGGRFGEIKMEEIGLDRRGSSKNK